MGSLLHKINLSAWREHVWVRQYWQPYYQGLVEREKRLLQFLVVIIPLILLLFTVVLPLYDAKQEQSLVLHALQKQALEAEALALGLQNANVGQAHESTMTVVDQTARRTHVRKFITRLRPQMGQGQKHRLLIQLGKAPYAPSMTFLAELSKQGLGLLQVKLQKTDLEGYVNIQMVVE